MDFYSNVVVDKSPSLRWLQGTRHTYVCETRSKMRVNGLRMENLIRSVVELQILAAPVGGSYRVRVHIQHSEQSQRQGLHQLLAALNQVSEVLELEVDALGYARHILNRPELLTRWAVVRATLRQQFRSLPETEPLLVGLDQQLATPGALEKSLLSQGVYGILFAGLLGRSCPLQPPGRVEAQVLPGFFGSQDLPLLVHTHAELIPAAGANAVRLLARRELASEAFDADRWRRLLRQITDTPTLDTALSLTGHAVYELTTLGGVLQQASQQLRAEVPGVYVNELTHYLTLQPTAL